MFEQQVKKADMPAVFTEHARVMNWCDPCAADPLSIEELRSLGVFGSNQTSPDLIPGRGRRPIMPPMSGAREVFVTPQPVRYDAQHFSEELVLHETAERKKSQTRQLADASNQMNLRSNVGQAMARILTCLPAAA